MLSQYACPPNNMTNWLGFIFNFNLLKKVGYQNEKKKKKKEGSEHIFSRKIQKLKINDFVSVENEDTSSEHKTISYGNSLKKSEDTGLFCVNEELMTLIDMAPS